MFTTNRDVAREILYKLDSDRDILNVCKLNKDSKEICNEDFFRNIVLKRYPKSIPFKSSQNIEAFKSSENQKIEAFKPTTWKSHYLKLIYYKDKIEREHGFIFSDGNIEKYYEIINKDETSGVIESIQNGYLDLLQHYIKIEVDLSMFDHRLNENMLMAMAAEYGHKEIVDYFISRGADNFNQAMAFATKGDHTNLVEYFISKGANNWNNGLFAAAEMANKELIIFFIKKGGTKNSALKGAATGGHLTLVKFFINQGATDINGALKYATHYIEDHTHETIEVITYLLSIGADVNIGLQEARELNNAPLIEYFLEIADIIRRRDN